MKITTDDDDDDMGGSFVTLNPREVTELVIQQWSIFWSIKMEYFLIW